MLSKSEMVWVVVRVGLLLWLCSQVCQMTQRDRELTWREIFAIVVMTIVCVLVLLLTGGVFENDRQSEEQVRDSSGPDSGM